MMIIIIIITGLVGQGMHPFHLKTIVHHLMVMAVDIQEGNILIISIQEEGSLVEVGCIQEVVIQVVAELILAGAGYIQVEVLAYILAEVGIVSRVKYKKTPHCAEFFYGVYEKLFG